MFIFVNCNFQRKHIVDVLVAWEVGARGCPLGEAVHLSLSAWPAGISMQNLRSSPEAAESQRGAEREASKQRRTWNQGKRVSEGMPGRLMVQNKPGSQYQRLFLWICARFLGSGQL